jgi:hypothetical protein
MAAARGFSVCEAADKRYSLDNYPGAMLLCFSPSRKMLLTKAISF